MKTILTLIMLLSVTNAFAADEGIDPMSEAAPAPPTAPAPEAQAPAAKGASSKKVIYKDTSIDFEGLSLDGELKAPGEFYFQNRNQERFDNLSKRRLNFRREMLRDAVQSN